MPIDPKKSRKVLVVHGVQTGTDADIKAHERIRDLIADRSSGLYLDFETELYAYEDVNDEAKEKLFKVIDFFTGFLSRKEIMGGLLGKYLDAGVDLVGDVLINLSGGSAAQQIRAGLVKRIEDIYAEGNPLYIVAHSLGTIYAFDAVNELIKGDNEYFDREDRKTWPVQSLVTMGSPIGLSMFDRDSIVELGEGRKYFRWVNYWARTDPVVSGSFYGKPQEGYRIAEKFVSDSDRSGWFVQDRVVDVGKAWLMAHTSYWDHPGIGDDLLWLITS